MITIEGAAEPAGLSANAAGLPANAAAWPVNVAASPVNVAASPVNVLLVDDAQANRAALRAILASPAYRIVEASSGIDALHHLLTDEFAVLLIDVVMPQMNGFELASIIKSRARTAAVPIVFVTGRAADIDFVYRGYRVGAVDYLIKPLVPEMVRAKVAVFAELFRQKKRIEQQAASLVAAERKESELRLVEERLASERRYRELAEAVPHIIWTARSDGTVDYFNRRWFEYTGVSADEAGGTWYRPVHPDDLPRCEKAREEGMRSGRMFEIECRVRRASDGVYRWHLVRAVPERDRSESVVSWLGTFTDIEDQKRAQAVLAEFKGTLDAVLDAVLIFEPRGWRFIYCNEGASALFGYGREELAPMRPVDFMVGYDDERFERLLAPLCEKTKRRVALEASCRRRDGKEIPVEFSFELVEIDGSAHMVSIAHDITERKLAELERDQLYREALNAVATRDEFLSVASHELRTPLSSLQLQIDMLLQPLRKTGHGVIPEQMSARLEGVAKQTHKLARLIAELMDVSRITAGRLWLDLDQVDLGEVAAEVIARFHEDAAKAKSVVRFVSSEPVIGRWDRLRIEQIVTNLLTNALKFGAGKPVEVTVSQDGPFGRLLVRDQGIGIAPEDAERIFQRFERASAARRFGGLGLGLYIVRQIVEAHGGTIRVDSRPGEGAVFTVNLPREPSAAKVETQPAEVVRENLAPSAGSPTQGEFESPAELQNCQS